MKTHLIIVFCFVCASCKQRSSDPSSLKGKSSDCRLMVVDGKPDSVYDALNARWVIDSTKTRPLWTNLKRIAEDVAADIKSKRQLRILKAINAAIFSNPNTFIDVSKIPFFKSKNHKFLASYDAANLLIKEYFDELENAYGLLYLASEPKLTERSRFKEDAFVNRLQMFLHTDDSLHEVLRIFHNYIDRFELKKAALTARLLLLRHSLEDVSKTSLFMALLVTERVGEFDLAVGFLKEIQNRKFDNFRIGKRVFTLAEIEKHMQKNVKWWEGFSHQCIVNQPIPSSLKIGSEYDGNRHYWNWNEYTRYYNSDDKTIYRIDVPGAKAEPKVKMKDQVLLTLRNKFYLTRSPSKKSYTIFHEENDSLKEIASGAIIDNASDVPRSAPYFSGKSRTIAQPLYTEPPFSYIEMTKLGAKAQLKGKANFRSSSSPDSDQSFYKMHQLSENGVLFAFELDRSRNLRVQPKLKSTIRFLGITFNRKNALRNYEIDIPISEGFSTNRLRLFAPKSGEILAVFFEASSFKLVQIRFDPQLDKLVSKVILKGRAISEGNFAHMVESDRKKYFNIDGSLFRLEGSGKEVSAVFLGNYNEFTSFVDESKVNMIFGPDQKSLIFFTQHERSQVQLSRFDLKTRAIEKLVVVSGKLLRARVHSDKTLLVYFRENSGSSSLVLRKIDLEERSTLWSIHLSNHGFGLNDSLFDLGPNFSIWRSAKGSYLINKMMMRNTWFNDEFMLKHSLSSQAGLWVESKN